MWDAVHLRHSLCYGTVTVLFTVVKPVLLLAFKVTEYVPALAYVFVGVLLVLVVPSPNDHSQAVGLLVDVS